MLPSSKGVDDPEMSVVESLVDLPLPLYETAAFLEVDEVYLYSALPS
jgi:hypothetical protein